MGRVSPDAAPNEGDRLTQGSRDLTTGSIPRHVIAFSLPMLAGNGLQIAYSLINGFWVGKFLGTDALAALTVSVPAIFVLIGMAAGLTLATNVLVAQHVGARDWARVKGVVQTSVALAAGVSALLLTLGLVFADRLLRVTGTPAEIFPAALHYMRIVLWTMPFSFGIFLIGSMLRGIGDSKTPVYFQAVSVAMNVALDPLLMFGWAGFPKLGLNGTAYATIISQAAAVVALVWYVPRRRPLVTPDWRRLRVDGATAWLLVKIGFPAMIQQSVVSISMMVLIAFVNRFGARTDAAFGAALRIDQVAFLPALTVGLAVSTLAGQNIGAGRFERVGEVFRWGLLLSGGICLVIAVLAMTIPAVFLRGFVSDPQVIAIGAGYLRIMGISYVLYAVMFVSNGVINGAGHTVPTTLITVITLWGVRLPLAATLPHYLHHETGIWYAMVSSVACGALLSLAYYFSGRWRQPIIGRGARAYRPAQ